MSAKQPALVRTEDELAHAVSVISSFPEYVIDIETDGVNPRTNALSWVGLGTYGEVFLIPMQHRRGRLVREERLTRLGKPSKARNPPVHKRFFADPGEQLMPDVVTAAIKPLLFNTEQTKIGHNVKFDMLSLSKYYGGKIPNGPFNDTLVMKARTVKNKTAPPQRVAVVDFYFDDVISTEGEILHRAGSYDTTKEVFNLALAFDVIEQRGAWYYHGEDRWQGKEALLESVREDKGLYDYLAAGVTKAVTGVTLPQQKKAAPVKKAASKKVAGRK